MLDFFLKGLGTLALILATLNIAIKLFAPDELVYEFFSSRNLDISIFMLFSGLTLVSLATILNKLDYLHKKVDDLRETISKD